MSNLTEKEVLEKAIAEGDISVSDQSVTHITDTVSTVVTIFVIGGRRYRCIQGFDCFDEFGDNRYKGADTINGNKIKHGNPDVLALYKEHGLIAAATLIANNV
jgi:hypothetical protein